MRIITCEDNWGHSEFLFAIIKGFTCGSIVYSSDFKSIVLYNQIVVNFFFFIRFSDRNHKSLCIFVLCTPYTERYNKIMCTNTTVAFRLAIFIAITPYCAHRIARSFFYTIFLTSNDNKIN